MERVDADLRRKEGRILRACLLLEDGALIFANAAAEKLDAEVVLNAAANSFVALFAQVAVATKSIVL